MPFTPFHFGPGVAIKAAMPKHFSFSVFCFAQVVTDCETAYYMFKDAYPLHRFFHTFVGATVVAVFSILIGRPLCQLALRIWSACPAPTLQQLFPIAPAISFGSAATSAFIGTYSHVVLDGIMHADVAPLMPFSSWNPFYRVVSVFTLHVSCIILGILGSFYVAFTNRNG